LLDSPSLLYPILGVLNGEVMIFERINHSLSDLQIGVRTLQVMSLSTLGFVVRA